MQTESCPCGSGRAFEQCCEPFLSGRDTPATAQALMRSRYTAYVHMDEDYLLQTWHASTRPRSLNFSQQPPQQWLGLKILSTEAGTADDTEGVVEFVARYKIQGKAFRLHETSRFVKEGGRWYYVEGDIKE